MNSLKHRECIGRKDRKNVLENVLLTLLSLKHGYITGMNCVTSEKKATVPITCHNKKLKPNLQAQKKESVV